MMNEYKDDINKIHASEELINKTLKKIEQEKRNPKKPEKTGKAKIIRFAAPVIAAAAAVFIFTNINMMDSSNLNVNNVDQIQVRTTDMSGLFSTVDEESENMTEEEFNKYVGFDCTKLFTSADFDKSVISGEKGTFYYENGDTVIVMRLSKSEDLVPEDMKELKTSDVSDHEVVIAKDDMNYHVSGEVKGVKFFMTTNCRDTKELARFLREFYRVVKG